MFIGCSFNYTHINGILSDITLSEKEVIIVDYNPTKEKTNHNLELIIGDDFEKIIETGQNQTGNILYCGDGIKDFLIKEQHKHFFIHNNR